MNPWGETDAERAATNADIARRTRAFSVEPDIEFFRQAGGCLEIRQKDEDDWDVVHIHDEEAFIRELQQFRADLPDRETES